MTSNSQPWWRSLYDDLLADVLLERSDPAEVDATLRFLTNRLELLPGMRVFDQCCGVGSLAVPLASSGYRLNGCDLIPEYVERARRRAVDARVVVELETADAFQFVPPQPCDAVFNWWTSFGYASTDDENVRMLDRAAEALRPGGRFALDFMNVTGVLRGFQSRVRTERVTARGTIELIRDSSIDLRRLVMLKRWTYTLPDGSRIARDSQVRMYLPHELVGLFARAGFSDVQLYGNLDGAPLELDSPRCIVVGKRPS